MTDTAFRSASALVRALRSGSLGSLELLDHYLARIARHNPTLNAIIAMDIEAARRRARAVVVLFRRPSVAAAPRADALPDHGPLGRLLQTPGRGCYL